MNALSPPTRDPSRAARLLAPGLWLLLFGCSEADRQEPLPASNPRPRIQWPTEERDGDTAKQTSAAGDKPDTRTVLPKFEIVSEESGFDFQRFDDISARRRITEVNGGGVGILDLDHDGLEDIFLPNGCRLPVDPTDRSTPGQFFRNVGRLQFREVSRTANLVQNGFGTGCAVGDWDGDGFADLYLTAFGPNRFWKNNGDGTFTEVELDANTTEWSTSAALADLNQDGWLDLFVVNYLQEDVDAPRLCPNPASPTGYEGCSPALFDGVADRLFLSNGTWQSNDVSDQPVLKSGRGKGLGVVVADLDNNQQPEVYVANDGEANFLYVVAGRQNQPLALHQPLALRDVAFEASVALNESGFAQAGMGIAAADYDRSGTLDLFLTHFYGDTNTLYANRGQLQFDDVTRRSRLGPPSRGTLGFGTAFADINNDGWPDLLVANGHVDDREWIDGGQPYRMPPQCFLNLGDGTFADVSASSGAYFQQKWLGRGLAISDFDCDGRQDIVIGHQLSPSVVLHNQTPAVHPAATLQLVGTTSNRDAVGAFVTMRDRQPVLRYWVIGGGSFQSASTRKIPVSTGGGKPVQATITWPGGTSSVVQIAPGQRYIAVQNRTRVYQLPMAR